jgi:quercetin dioxygenase-like cupin family protein
MKAQPVPASATIAVEVAVIAHEMHTAEAEAHGSRAGRTLVREDDLRVVLLALAAGAKLADHHVKDTATIFVVEGKVRVGIPGRELVLTKGQLLPLGRGLEHDVEALERTTLLLTLAQLGD